MKKIALLLVVLLLMSVGPGAGLAATDQEIYDRIHFMNQQIDEMEANSVCSNVYIDSSWIDLSQVSTTGSVTSYTYRGGNPVPTIDNFTITPRSFDSALDKVVRYVLGNVANTYRQEPLNTETTMITYQRTTVPIYVYGPYKVQELDEILLGLPNCFDIVYDTSSGRSNPVTPIEMPIAEETTASILSLFSVSSTTLTVSSSDSTSEPTTIEMDVAPEIINDRTYVPVRYLAYALGVPEEGVTWDGATETVTITSGDTTLGLTIGSTTETVNGESVEMDVAPYVKEIETGGRTMLPARWVAEPLGATVTWIEESQQMQIELPQAQEIQTQNQQN